MVIQLLDQEAPVTQLAGSSSTQASYIDTTKKVAWTPIPIEVDREELKVRPELMEINRPYRIVWGGKEMFALRRDSSDKVEFFVVKLEKIK